MSSIFDWSMTAANNATSDALVNWNEGQAPSTVNNSAREMMARIAEYLGDNGGALTAGGTANALTVTANSAFTAYANGLVMALRIATDNSGAATLNVNGIGAKSIRQMLASGESALVGGELQATGIYILMYSEALNSAAGGWLLLNPTPADQSSYVTLTGTQTLTNKTLTTPTIATPAITGGTASSFTMTGSAFNGTVGATTPSTIAGTTGTFSGNIFGAEYLFTGDTDTGLGTFDTNSVSLIAGNSIRATFTLASGNTINGNTTINGTLTVTG